MQKSGAISALIEEVRKNISKANSLSNAYNGKMKEKAVLNKKQEELAVIKAQEAEKQKKLEEDIQKLTNEYIAKLDKMSEMKEKEIMTV